jgi:lysine 2,3-aminomutase
MFPPHFKRSPSPVSHKSKCIDLDKVAINAKSHKLLQLFLQENPELEKIMLSANDETEALAGVEKWTQDILKESPTALAFCKSEENERHQFESLTWHAFAAVRLVDYIKNAGKEYEDLNLKGEWAINNPIKMIWLAVKFGTGGAKPYFFEDTIQLFRQLKGKSQRTLPSKDQVERWMDRWPSGLDHRILPLLKGNKKRILYIIIDQIDKGEHSHSRFKFSPNMSREEKFQKATEWWNDYHFHLAFAVRSPDALNKMLDGSLDPDVLKVLYEAKKKGIPFFVNPYYLSLLLVRTPDFAVGADLALRDYVIYSKHLVEEFGTIMAWEKEDLVEPGKPNAAGWLLPTHNNIHRRYPDVAILIPDTVGRACGGLCSSCQRMYDFQRGNLNFDLKKLEPHESWPEKLCRLMDYFENDSQLRDILITGGDALMNSDHSIKEILDAVYDMSVRKKSANQSRKDGEKYAEIVRVRLGTRLPIYIPQRITDELINILAEFKTKASQIGIKQFLIQTHFESPLEITPESEQSVKKLISAGWTVTNQLVLSTSASRRGHTVKLRKALNEIGVLTYYTFTVKGYMENKHNFATNSRAVQEQMEEKFFGLVDGEDLETIRHFPFQAEKIKENINELLEKANIPFLASDRNILNLPGVGKSLTFRVIGITRYGRRILEFEHDTSRSHSPIIDKMGKVIIVESKSISEYLNHLEEIGEDISEYESLWGYSMSQTEERMPIYEYPKYDFEVTKEVTNLVVE